MIGMWNDLIQQLSVEVRRYQRRVARRDKRELKHAQYAVNGLNGPRAMARRARQYAKIKARLEAHP